MVIKQTVLFYKYFFFKTEAELGNKGSKHSPQASILKRNVLNSILVNFL